MKGISPIVAAVLLIAVTMTLAGGLALWATKLVSEKLPAETEVECKFAGFDFFSCRYDSATKTLIFSLSNQRDVELKNLTAHINYPNGSVCGISCETSGIILNGTLGAGIDSIKTFTISDISPDFSSILIRTSCPGVTASNKCTRS